MTIHAIRMIVDATPRRDPTGTEKLRRSFRAEADLRLRKLRSLLRQGVIEYDTLGIGLGSAVNRPRMFVAPADRLRTFSRWFSSEAQNIIAGSWADDWVRRAISSGLSQAEQEVGPATAIQELDHLTALTHSELLGIASAVSQHVTRAAANLVGRRASVGAVMRIIGGPISTIGAPRLVSLANTITVKAHNDAKLAVYRARGISQVGITPETKPAPVRVGDADDDEMVGVLTAGDDLVCQACEDIASDAPYTIDEASGLIPAHPNCRCSFFPWFDNRYAGEEEVD